MLQETIDTTYSTPQGGTLHFVGATDDLQTILDIVKGGDVVEIEAGATFTGFYTLRKFEGEGWAYIRSSRHTELPNGRINPSHTALMPKLIAPDPNYNLPTVAMDAGAHHYRLVGIEIAMPSSGQTIFNMGQQQYFQVLEELPRDVVLDRVYIHSENGAFTRRGVAMNGIRAAVVNSYISEIHDSGNDTQAILATNTPGPLKIENNYLEASGENIMFGGGDPAIHNVVPSDIEIRDNHFRKPTTWKPGHPDYAGTTYSCKNLFEIKNARRVLLEDNLMENSWVGSQHGFAIVVTPRNADGSAPWSAAEDITIQNNTIKNVTAGVSMLAQTGVANRPAQNLKRITVHNNLFVNDDASIYDTTNRVFQISCSSTLSFLPLIDVTITNNTAINEGNVGTFLTFGDTGPGVVNLVFQKNIVMWGLYGLNGTGSSVGQDALDDYVTGWVFDTNGVIVPPGLSYVPEDIMPPNNVFTDLATANLGPDYKPVDPSPLLGLGVY